MSADFVHSPLEWNGDRFWTSGLYPCRVRLIPEDDGTWSAIVLNLPGAGSCGATEKEVLENVREAVRGLIASYTEDGQSIPWCDISEDDIPANAKELSILVNADVA